LTVPRGVLTDEQLRNIQEAIGGVVADLADHDASDPVTSKAAAAPATQTTAEPQRLPVLGTLDSAAGPLAPAWSGAAPVLCIAPRGPLDEAAGAMLAQLLEKHGLHARVVGQNGLSRAFGAAEARKLVDILLN
jgi:hypothetical protein